MSQRLFVHYSAMHKYDKDMNIIETIYVGVLLTTLCITSIAYAMVLKEGLDQFQLVRLENLRDYFVSFETKVDMDLLKRLADEYYIRYCLLYFRDDGVPRDVKNPTKQENTAYATADVVASVESYWHIVPGLMAPAIPGTIDHALESRAQRKAIVPYNVAAEIPKKRTLPPPLPAPVVNDLTKDGKPPAGKGAKRKYTKKAKTEPVEPPEKETKKPQSEMISNVLDEKKIGDIIANKLQTVLTKRAISPVPSSPNTMFSPDEILNQMRANYNEDKKERKDDATLQYERQKEVVDRHETFRANDHVRSMEMLDKILSASSSSSSVISTASSSTPAADVKKVLNIVEKKQYISSIILI